MNCYTGSNNGADIAQMKIVNSILMFKFKICVAGWCKKAQSSVITKEMKWNAGL